MYTAKHKIAFEIDDDDFETVSMFSWHINPMPDGYPRTMLGPRSRQKKVSLHAFLLGAAPPKFKWDHEDRNKLNNTRKNLRLVTDSVNARNVSPSHRNISGVVGVTPYFGRWRVTICADRKNHHVGDFKTLEEAASARKEAEVLHWGTSL